MPHRPAHTPSPHAPGRALVRVGGALLCDPIVAGAIVTFAAFAGAFLLPVLSRDARDVLGDAYLTPIGMSWAVVACFYRLREVREPDERRFWVALGAGLALWLAALCIDALVPESAWTIWWSMTTATLFLLYYVPVILALLRESHREDPARLGAMERRLEVGGVLSLAMGWMVYSAVVPVILLGQNGIDFIANWAVDPTLDALVVVSLGSLLWRCRAPRWRVLYAALAVAATAAFALDVLDTLGAFGKFSRQPTSVQSLLWDLPSLAFVLAIRLRHVSALDDLLANTIPPDRTPLLPGAHAVLLVLGASSLPVMHLALSALGLMPRSMATVENLVAVVGMFITGSLAVVAYWHMEQQRLALQRDQYDTETRLGQAQKMEAIGRLAGGVAHDFNNLLTVIGGNSDLARDMLAAGGAAESIDEVRRATERATSLTRQLLTLSHRHVGMPRRIRLNQVVGDVRRALERLVGPSMALHTELDPEAGWILVDAGQMEQVIVNLVVNARDAIVGTGTITIRTANVELGPEDAGCWTGLSTGRYVQLEVHDTGNGIPADVLPRIFEPFFTTKSRGTGTGLGLSTVHSIVRQSGGGIRVESAEGAGATFQVRLARVPAPPVPETRPAIAPTRPGSETVLVVEDETAVRQIACTVLARCGYTVLEAVDGLDAIVVSDGFAGSIDLLLTDVVMPGLKGGEVAERLLTSRPGIKVLFMTGYADDDLKRYGLRNGRTSVLAKPFATGALAAAVRQVLDGASVPGRLPATEAWSRSDDPPFPGTGPRGTS